MTKADDVTDEDVVKHLNKVSKAMRTAQLTLLENGFDEKLVEKKKKRNAEMIVHHRNSS